MRENLHQCSGLPTVHFLSPGPLETLTGGFIYARRMVAGLEARGRLASVITLPDRFPFPDSSTTREAAAAVDALADGSWLIVDGLAFAPLLPLWRAAAGRLRLIALIHHALCDETGLSETARRTFFNLEAEALCLARHVIVSSRMMRVRLADFGVSSGRITVVSPGVETIRKSGHSREHARGRLEGIRLLTVGNLTPRKGHDVLVAALAQLRQHPWTLWLVGESRDLAWARRLRALVTSLELDGRITWLRDLPPTRLHRLYGEADLFILPSRYEGYGMAFAEAMAAGLPVVGTTAGAIPEVVPATAGVLVPPGDSRALARALGALLNDPARRRMLARGASTAPAARRNWAVAEAEFVDAIARAIDP